MDCLLEKLDDERMTDICEERLLEIQYFVARDYRYILICVSDSNCSSPELKAHMSPEITGISLSVYLIQFVAHLS